MCTKWFTCLEPRLNSINKWLYFVVNHMVSVVFCIWLPHDICEPRGSHMKGNLQKDHQM